MGGANYFDYDLNIFKNWPKLNLKLGLLDNLIFGKMRVFQ